MKQTKWNEWIGTNTPQLPETTRQFLQDAQLHSIGEDEVTFTLLHAPITFKKLSPSVWTMPSSLFAPYGSLSGLFTGFNILLEENDAA